MNAGRRLWFLPAGMAGQFTLLVVVLLMLGFWVGGGIYVSQRATTALHLFKESVAERIAVIVPLIERTPPAERPDLLRALHSPTLRIMVTEAAWPPAGAASGSWGRRHARALRTELPDLGGRQLEIQTYGHWRGPPAPRVQGPSRNSDGDLLHSRAKARISVALESGGWIHFIVAARALSLRWALRTVFWMAAATVVILAISFWVTFRLTRPLRRFSEAAERIGTDVRSPPLRVDGSRELRNAARAFNRMQERLRHLVDDRTMMLAAISHDLRTFLTRLRLRAEFIAEKDQYDKALADLDDMQSMLDSTLAFARDDAADEPRTSTDLVALVQSLCDDLADAGQAVTYAGPDRVLVTCAPRAVKRAIHNVLSNAIKYGREAAVRISSDEHGVTVDIADRGPGIPADQREAAFRPFHRLDASRSRESGGSGLGLAVARSVARRHGGDVVMSDREGGGLIVSLRLPRTAIPPA